ncbi:hypothetical protein [Pseudobacteriovorax antillogorgiicola]|uniref:Uncharacterized protein n=1 Tax=Pseudobacteriovorax antillogorgiicola TaxID=1513793 RepID=A0A1Y6BA04_9BACT|nr:hypothetical protein [Pseudobacteriovorax antillogorgiicola]TCS59314.1 hypothetical protein EDD56_101221 [Pseudobacteriovorax antillogorgiicola]SME89485.1 hypothetical protein SAMN06296036_101265 [Pseudobacteriovorax antillogorgiicola]
MSVPKTQQQRKRRLCYWDSQKKSVGAVKLNFERHLRFLPEFDLVTLKALDDEKFAPCDLLIISAEDIPSEDFSQWLQGINKRIVNQGQIWTPALIFSETDFVDLSSEIHDFADNNWYFDILNPLHLESMPIRVANLLRIHDHLHELWRYKDQLDTMQEQINEIEKRLNV